MHVDPPVPSTLQPITPTALDHLVRTCLAKKRDDRWQTAGDIGRQLTWIAESGSRPDAAVFAAATPQRARRRLALPLVLTGAVVGGIIIGVAVWSIIHSAPSAPRPLTQFIVTSPDTPLTLSLVHADVAISPDGTGIVYTSGAGPHRNSQLYLRRVDQLEATPVRGTDNASNPFFSADGGWIGFSQGGVLKKIPVTGGPPIPISDLSGGRSAGGRGASWGPDAAIVFAASTGLMRVPAVGGEPEVLTEENAELEETSHRRPDVLPNGKAVLFGVSSGSPPTSRIAIVSLETAEVAYLGLEGSNPVYSPTGHIVYGVGGSLRAVGFDPERLALTTDPVPVLENVTTKGTGAVNFDLSRSGTLVYSRGGGEFGLHTLVWVNRDGSAEPIAEGLGFRQPRLSPDGTRMAVTMVDSEGNRDVYVYDLDSGTPTRLTFDLAADQYPLWTADGREVVFRSNRGGAGQAIFRTMADGTGDAVRLVTGSFAFAVSADDALVFGQSDPETRDDLYILPMDHESSPVPLLQTEFDEEHATVSPDGQWFAYTTDEAGLEDIYARPFPNANDDKRRISTGGAREPLWGSDGELFYRGVDGMMSVRIETQPAFRLGTPTPLFDDTLYVGGGGTQYDVAPDGRFLMTRPGDASTPEVSVVAVQNWHQELKRLVPVD